MDVGNLILNASQIEYVEKYDYLGVTIETGLKFKRHIEKSFTRINNEVIRLHVHEKIDEY